MRRYFTFLFLSFFCLQYGQELYHDTQGALEISSSGSATYTLPIALPPSIQDVGPTINLMYSGGSMHGIAGQGWNISTISMISRIATRRDIDGFIDGVDFDDNDKLALDGQRLLLKTGTYWGDGSTYETELYSNTKIQLFGSGATMYFVVTAPDGSQSIYGNHGGENGIEGTAFYIVQFIDSDGNVIDYQYEKPFFKNLCIKRILFSKNRFIPQAAHNKIEFFYKEINRIEIGFLKGEERKQSLLLDRIEVFTKNNLFRKYVLEHIEDEQLGYEKLIKIQEFNGNNEPANPIEFEYETTATDNSVNAETINTYPNNLNFEEIALSGDFDGDGKLDFVSEDHKLYHKLFDGLGQSLVYDLPITIHNQDKLLTGVTLENNKLNQKQSLIRVKQNSTLNTIDFDILNFHGALATSTFTQPYTKTVSLPYYGPYGDSITENIVCGGNCYDIVFQIPSLCWNAEEPYLINGQPNPNFNIYCNQCNEVNPVFPRNKFDYKIQDFNGDGISEVLIIFTEVIKRPLHKNFIGENGGSMCVGFKLEEQPKRYFILDLNPNEQTSIDTKGFHEIADASLFHFEDEHFGVTQEIIQDFNGDGKVDILNIIQDFAPFIYTQNTYKVIGFKQNNSMPFTELELLANGSFDEFEFQKLVMAGDFNGDGKADIIMPNSKNGGVHETLWHIYYGNIRPQGGIGFTKKSVTITKFHPVSTNFQYRTFFNSYYVVDTNRDGKSDMVRIELESYRPGLLQPYERDTKWKVYTYANVMGLNYYDAPDFVLDYQSASDHDSSNDNLPIPIVSNYTINNKDADVIMIIKGSTNIITTDFTRDFTKDILLKKVTRSGGNIVDEIFYDRLRPIGFPYVTSNGVGLYSSDNSLNYPLVEVNNLSTQWAVKQLKNTAVGVVKFQDFKYKGYVVDMNGLGHVGFKATARSSWYTASLPSKIWSVAVYDYEKRGALTSAFNRFVHHTNIFDFALNGNDDNIISKEFFQYDLNTQNSVYKLNLIESERQDFLRNFKTKTNFTYQDFNLLDKKTIRNYQAGVLEGTTEIDYSYENNPTGAGVHYYIGRPSGTVTTTSAYQDTYQSEEQLVYENNQLVKKRTRGNDPNGVFIEEHYDYFINGNLKSKTIKAPGAVPTVPEKTVSYTYDDSHRFIKTTTDADGFVTTNISYHPLYGLVTKSVNHFGFIIDFEFDDWGKQTKSVDIYGNTTVSTYAKTGNEYTTSVEEPDGSASVVIMDALGRVKQKGVKGFNNLWSATTTTYDFLGRKVSESEPFNLTTGSPNQFNTTVYDDYGRVSQQNLYTGKEIVYSYAGATVTVDDGVQLKTTTTNSNEHTIASTDSGGEIVYSYYANGKLKSSQYGDVTLFMEYDSWGKRTRLTDPCAGEYTYSYTIYGDILTETTPNGTSSYTYYPDGRLQTKQVTGQNTDNTTIHYYDTATKLPTEIKYIDNMALAPVKSTYFVYDSFLRPEKVTETMAEAKFEKQFSYDGLGRVANEQYMAQHFLANAILNRTFTYFYNNGILGQIKDQTTNEIKWQLSQTNARGQTTEYIYDDGDQKAQFDYDDYGLPRRFDYFTSGGDVYPGAFIPYMTLQTTFDAERGNLTQRSYSFFGATEYFEYDELDRLLNVQTGGSNDTHDYDEKGRIRTNKLGDYNYSGEKPYQVSSLEPLTGLSETHYHTYKTQSIDYNAVKDPVYINDKAGGNFYFDYNEAEERQIMYYGGGITKQEMKQRRYYSSDGSFEIDYNVTTNTASILFYVGGDAYSAPMILRKEGNSNPEYVYIARDYLGSVLALTRTGGVIAEKRHFNAWGETVLIKNNMNQNLTSFRLLDRGYTGHEHILKIGLINMNGRLYDPLLRRFLQPDNYVQDPSNTQNFNRYSYVLNNPLRYVDPSGEELVLGTIALIGAAVSALTYTITSYLTETPITAEGFLKSAAIGAFTSAVTFGIGSGAEAAIGNFWVRATVQAVAHGGFQGGMTAIQGGKFWASFASASISSFANSMLMGGVHITKGNEPYTMTMRTVKGIGGNFSRTTTGALAFGAVSGGAGARLAGGNFWQGAVTGLFVTGFNHLMHSVIDGDGDGGGDPKTKKYKGSLKSSYGEKVYTLEEWYRAYADSSYFEITTDAGYKQGLPAGPKMRYVRNPIDGNVMDMRHVTVIGYNMLEFLGDAVEIIQYGTGDYSNSAYNIQDYYSNKIGSYFYEMRNSGSWASSSFAYDFKRFIITQYKSLQSAIISSIPKN